MSCIVNLTKNYGDFYLSIPKLDLDKDGITALMGPSGSGKTSLFRILLGIESADTGEWLLDGENVLKQPAKSRRLGAVFQNYELFWHLTVRDNIYFAAEARGINKDESYKTFEQLVSHLKINEILDRKVEVLSGGEKQRVAIARALMGRPRYVLLDEPFAALDAPLKAQARSLLKDVLSVSKIPALLITHDVIDAQELGARLIQIEDIKAKS